MEDEKIGEIRKKLAPNVELAYLFGSAASERTGKLSDIDIGVYLDEGLSMKDVGRIKMKIINDLTSLLKSDKVDITVMNNAPVSLNYEIIKCNKPISIKDEEKRIDVEQRILSTYLDRKYHEKLCADIFLKKVMDEGLGYR